MSGDAQSRRHFLGTAAAAATAFVIAGCTSHKKKPARTPSTAPDAETASFGEVIDAGSLDHILDTIDAGDAPHYVPAARAYVTRFPAEQIEAAKDTYPKAVHPSLDLGVVVLYQRCTHLGCRTPWCTTSHWFECPCHGAKFDQVGEKRGGPAPRGLDLMRASARDGHLMVDSGAIVEGMPIGTNTTHQDPAGPFCV